MHPTVESVRRWAGLIAAGIGATVLIGWATDVEVLRSVRPGYTPMVPWTAVGFLLVGVGLARSAVRWAWVLATGAAVMGLVHLADAVLDERLWPVDALFHDAVTEMGPSRRGLMSPLTAVLFGSCAIGLVGVHLRWRRLWVGASAFTLTGAVLAVVGYLYGVSTLYTFGEYTAMSLPTAVAFAIVAIGTAADSTHPLVRAWSDRGTGGWLIRRALPVALVVPPTLGGLQLALTRQDVYDVELGLALIAVSWVAVDVAVLTLVAGQLRRLGEERAAAWREVGAARRRLVAAARERGRDTAAMATPSLVGLLRIDPSTGATSGDARFSQLAGGAAGPEGWLRCVHPEDRADVEERVRRAMSERGDVDLLFRFLHPDGKVVHVLGAGGPDADAWSCAFADITVEVVAEEAAALVEASFRASPIGTAIVDADGRVFECNEALSALMRASASSLCGRPLVDCVDRPDRALLARLIDSAPARADLRIVTFEGTPMWADVNVSPIPETSRALVSFIDVTMRHDVEEQLTQQALRDPLTGLANRVFVHERLGEALARSERSGDQVAVLFCDLDAFKVVNDSLGHEIGDRVLIEVAARLQHAVRPFDVIGRMGGDEFVIVCEDADRSAATQVAQRIKQRLVEPIVTDGHELAVGVSIGITVSTPGTTGSDMIRDADTAMYRAKSRGRDRYEMFDGDLREGAVRRFELEQALRRGIDGEAFGVGYEAVFDLSTGMVAGAEALLRWVEPGGGAVSPQVLLPIAEDSGLIRPLGDRVLVDALASVAAWRSAGHDLWVAVNVSAKQLGGHHYADAVERAIAANAVQPDWLVVELTESALADIPGSAVRDLQHLRELGVRVAIDDFGTGWSSLERLRSFDVDILKIDRMFVAGIGTDRVDESIVQGLVELASRLELTTVAEGVETSEQFEALRAYGCDLAQGYLLHRAAGSPDIAALASDAAAEPTS